MIDIKAIETDPDLAKEKWHQYVDEYKKTKSQQSRVLRDVYNHAKKGAVLVDIEQAIKAGSQRFHKNGYYEPNLAVCQSLSKKCYCFYKTNGSLKYNNHGSSWNEYKADVLLPPGTLQTFTFIDSLKHRSHNEFETLVPQVPKSVYSAPLTAHHYTLFEVDEWKPVIHADPVLLQRIFGTIFIYRAQWDITPLEQLVMKQFI